MFIKCFRCGKDIDTPNCNNADYVIAEDTVVREPREILIALRHNRATLAKKAKMAETNLDGSRKHPDLVINDSEYDRVEVPDVATAYRTVVEEDLIRVQAEIKDKDIQKTGIVCPNCYKPTDTIIWGVHKRE